jgi:hypothetical protein
MEPIKEGDRVRYSNEFLVRVCHPHMVNSRAKLVGTVIAIFGREAQIDFGSAFRATSTVEIVHLERI